MSEDRRLILRPDRVVSSATDPSPVLPERLQQKRQYAEDALHEPFVGVTADGTAVSGLFPLRRTGVSLVSVMEAARTFLAALDDDQQASAVFPIDSDWWRGWHNIHPNLMRHGLCLADVDPKLRELALNVVRKTMSAAGFDLARDVMRLNEHLGDLSGEHDEFAEWFYWISMFGEPSETEPWGWQIDGHHLIVNCFIRGDQLVLTPNFIGSEPVFADSGKFAGTRVFAEEEAGGYALMAALTEAQRTRATVGSKLPVDVFAGSTSDNLVLPYEGIGYVELEPAQQQLLLDLVARYVGRMRDDHAAIKLDEVKAHLPETRFAWIGAFDEESPFYYRVHSPVLLIEFDHQAGTVFANNEPTRSHIHTLVRTPNGNDYGKDLLRAHYEQFDHSHPHTPHRRGEE